MSSRAIISRIVVGLIVLVACQIVWEHTALSGRYHGLIAACAQRLYGAALASGTIPDIHVDGDEFVVNVGGPKHEKLHVGALDVTGNLCVLLALFVASATRARWRTGLIAFVAAFALLFALHLAGLYVLAQTALAWHAGLDEHAAGLVASLGPWMYPVVALLWVPYLLWSRRSGPAQTR
jgi:hypothetical protein